MSSFGKTSAAKLAECHADLLRVFNEAIKDTPVDFGISWSVRGRADQDAFKAEGKSKAAFGRSPHNFRPALAVDIFPIVNGTALWTDGPELRKCADHIMDVAETLGVDLTWGGDFNHDGDATTSDSWDKYHFQVKDWKALTQYAEPAE
jgi:peptidoglycan L-alanyl-D-glutamate endopeptidase CwlK